MGSECDPVGNRPRTVWVRLWANRTKVVGYTGVIVGAIYMAVLQGQHWQLALMGAIVAALGHYNDSHAGQT